MGDSTQYGYFEHDWSFSAEQRLTVLDHFEQLHKAMERVLYYGFGILCNHNILWARTQLVTFGVIERVISDDIGILWKVKQQVHHELRPVTHKCVLRFMRGLRATRAMSELGMDLSNPLIKVTSAIVFCTMKVYGSGEGASRE